MINPYERVNTVVRNTGIRIFLMVTTSFGMLLGRDIEGVRDALPEPFDVMDHAGNIAQSVIWGPVGGISVGAILADRANESGDAPSTRSLRIKMALGGFVFGAVVNGIGEYGAGLTEALFPGHTSDPIDFVYGVTTAAAAAGLVPKIERHTTQLY